MLAGIVSGAMRGTRVTDVHGQRRWCSSAGFGFLRKSLLRVPASGSRSARLPEAVTRGARPRRSSTPALFFQPMHKSASSNDLGTGEAGGNAARTGPGARRSTSAGAHTTYRGIPAWPATRVSGAIFTGRQLRRFRSKRGARPSHGGRRRARGGTQPRRAGPRPSRDCSLARSRARRAGQPGRGTPSSASPRGWRTSRSACRKRDRTRAAGRSRCAWGDSDVKEGRTDEGGLSQGPLRAAPGQETVTATARRPYVVLVTDAAGGRCLLATSAPSRVPRTGRAGRRAAPSRSGRSRRRAASARRRGAARDRPSRTRGPRP